MRNLRMSLMSCVAMGALGIATVTYAAESAADLKAIQALLQQYRATQDSGDLIGQSKLMTPDRIWTGQSGIRFTDNVQNMRIQQAENDAMRKEVPGVQNITTDRDVIIKFRGEGNVAVVSFYRTAVRLYPAGTSKELRERYGDGGYETGTLVLEKQQGEWKIVHTHWSGPF